MSASIERLFGDRDVTVKRWKIGIVTGRKRDSRFVSTSHAVGIEINT